MFDVLIGGCHTKHSKGFFMNRPNGLNHYLLLLVKSRAQFLINGKPYICMPDSAVLIKPGIPYSYSNPEGIYFNDWLHFTCAPGDFALKFDNLFHQPFPVSNPEIITGYIRQILWENGYASKDYRSSHIHMLFSILWNHLYTDFHSVPLMPYSPYSAKLQDLRLRLQSEPYKKYSADTAAKVLGISTSYFQHLYTEFFQTSFQSDLIQMRVSYAKELISDTDMTMEQVAEACGYASEVHFYRQFRKITGMTPKEYREKNASILR